MQNNNCYKLSDKQIYIEQGIKNNKNEKQGRHKEGMIKIGLCFKF